MENLVTKISRRNKKQNSSSADAYCLAHNWSYCKMNQFYPHFMLEPLK